MRSTAQATNDRRNDTRVRNPGKTCSVHLVWYACVLGQAIRIVEALTKVSTLPYGTLVPYLT